MKFIIGVVCLTLILAVSAEETSPTEELVPSAYDYHRRFGIPRATEIKQWEDENVGKVGSQRIVGGWIIDISEVPYQAGLVINLHHGNYVSVCGASLISNTRLVTAAHCWGDGQSTAASMTVVLGSNFLFHGGQRIHTTHVVMYPGWNPSILHADMAVIGINHVTFTNLIQPISLLQGDEVWWDLTGWTSMASGFGGTGDGAGIHNDQRISAVNLPIMSDNDCRNFYGHWYHSNNICTSGYGGRGTCGGDSGGPLITTINNRRVLIGASSYVSGAGCQAGHPAVYARISSFMHWIWTI